MWLLFASMTVILKRSLLFDLIVILVQHYLNSICQIPGIEGIRRDILRDDEQVNYA